MVSKYDEFDTVIECAECESTREYTVLCEIGVDVCVDRTIDDMLRSDGWLPNTETGDLCPDCR